MKIQNITDVEKFFKVIDQCKGTVELVSPEGDRINLKSKLAQYLSMATIFSNGYIKELDLVAHDKEDIERLNKCVLAQKQLQAPIYLGSHSCFFIIPTIIPDFQLPASVFL